MMRTCRPFSSVKEVGGSEVNVVWAKAPVAETQSASAATANRCAGIVTYMKIRTQSSGTSSCTILTLASAHRGRWIGNVKSAPGGNTLQRSWCARRHEGERRRELFAILSGGRIVFLVQ